MKLTLRTLIAFLDGTIDEDSAAELRKKIKETPPIQDLIKRIRDVVAQAQLPAPKPMGRGPESNPNYPSEYLDGTLDVEKVAEYEKLLLGSDPLLAEIAEVHQILANLNEIDEGVSGRLRHRLYRQTESIYKSNTDEPGVFPVIEDHESIVEEYLDEDAGDSNDNLRNPAQFSLTPPREKTSRPQARRQPEGQTAPPVQAPPVAQTHPVPSTAQAKESRNFSAGALHADAAEPLAPPKPKDTRFKTPPVEAGRNQQQSTNKDRPRQSVSLFAVILATACVTALICLIAVSYLYPPNNSATAQNQQTENNKPESNGGPAADSKVTDENPSPKEPAVKNANQPKETGETDADNGTAPSDLRPRKKMDETDPVANPSQENPESVAHPRKADTPAGNAADDKKKEENEEDVINLFKDKKYDQAAKSPAKGPVDKQPGTETDGKPNLSHDRKKKSGQLSDSRELMAGAVKLVDGPPVGVFKSIQEPTARRTHLPDARWICLMQENQVHLNDSVQSFPGVHSTLEILESVRLRMHGLTRIELHDNPGKILPVVDVHFGAIELENLKDPNNTIDLRVQGQKIQTTFVDGNSRLGLLLKLPDKSAGLAPIVQLAALQGRGILKTGSEVISLEPGQVLDLSVLLGKDKGPAAAASEPGLPGGTPPGKNPVKKFTRIPEVFSSKPSALEQSAKELFFDICRENPVLDIAIAKSMTDTRPYLRQFSATAAFAMENPNPLINFLNDQNSRGLWRNAAIQVRRLLLENGELFRKHEKLATNVEAGNRMSEVKKQLFSFLTVSSDLQLTNGLDRDLVTALESPDLATRVVAIQTLFSITEKTKFYRPEDPPEKRQKWIRAWKKSLDNKEIRFLRPFQISAFE